MSETVEPDSEWPGPPPSPEVLIETLRLILRVDEDIEWYRAQLVHASYQRLPGESHDAFEARHDRVANYGRVYEWLVDQAANRELWMVALARMKPAL